MGKKTNIYLSIQSYALRNSFRKATAESFKDNELCPVWEHGYSWLKTLPWSPTGFIISTWMSLWHLKPSTASFKLCSPFPPHLNTLLLVYPTCISGHSRPETMRPASFSLCMPHNIYKQILSAVPPEHTQTLTLPHLTQTATFSS